MAIYHFLVQGFPIVLWYTAALFVLVRVLSDGRIARALGAAVTPLILLGVLAGAVAYVLGLLAWPLSATVMSPLGGNHLLMASWTLAFWTVLLVFAWRLGDALWERATGWLMLLMAAFGVVMVTITGTLGGSMAGNPSAVSDLVRALGWEVYWWAYLRPASILVFDHTPVVSAILWGRYAALRRAALEEIEAGERVLQAACVYGDLSLRLAQAVGPQGRLDIIDIAPLQAGNCRRKLGALANARVRVANAATPGGGPYDAVLCFFLLHELPDDEKRHVADALLASLAPGGRAIFVDYHRPHRLHPLRGAMSAVFHCLEPFAKSLWRSDIAGFATRPGGFAWRKTTYFGGLYQKVVATRLGPVGESGRVQ